VEITDLHEGIANIREGIANIREDFIDSREGIGAIGVCLTT
jgi:hypothetical protein